MNKIQKVEMKFNLINFISTFIKFLLAYSCNTIF